MSAATPLATRPRADDGPVRPVAVIDIGTTAIRMAVAEIDAAGNVRPLDTLSQAVQSGATRSRAGASRTRRLKTRPRSQELPPEAGGIPDRKPEQIRIVATSAVREAANRMHFIDRIYIATGLEVAVLDERGQPHHVHGRAALPAGRAGAGGWAHRRGRGRRRQHGSPARAGRQRRTFATYRLGSLRMQQTLQAYRASASKQQAIMENVIDQTVEQVVRSCPARRPRADDGPGRRRSFAASQILPDWTADELGKLPFAPLERFTAKMLGLTPDEIVQKYHTRLSPTRKRPAPPC